MFFGVFIFWPLYITNIVQYEYSVLEAVLYYLVLFSIIPGYFILPGLIKATFSEDNIWYFELRLFLAFTTITLGIGPSLIFFFKYEPQIRKIIKKQNQHNHTLENRRA